MKGEQLKDGFGIWYEPIPWDGCWLWLRTLVNGYGQLWWNGKMRRAHRRMYSLTKGEIPEGVHVLHSCDNRSCVNPDHLWLGTNADNMHDKYLKNRQNKGETHGMHVLTEDNVRGIRRLIKQGETHRQIAQLFGVSEGAIGNINLGRTWAWLDAQGDD